jgi:hypothetical protein
MDDDVLGVRSKKDRSLDCLTDCLSSLCTPFIRNDRRLDLDELVCLDVNILDEDPRDVVLFACVVGGRNDLSPPESVVLSLYLTESSEINDLAILDCLLLWLPWH